MKTIEIKGSFRNETGKKHTRQLRKAGNVPCIIYGKEKNINFSAPENSFKNLVYTHEAHIVKLNIEEQDYKAVLHDMQFHPVSDRILHADFVQIFDCADRAERSAFRCAIAQIAFQDLTALRIIEGAAKRANLDAHPAFDAFGCIHQTRAGNRIFRNRMLWADGHAAGLFTLHTHDGCRVRIPIPFPNFDARASRIEFLFVKQ